MTSLTRDICPSCGAWLILSEVLYVAPPWRRYPGVGTGVVYECPGCAGLFETWAVDTDPLEAMTPARIALRSSLAARRPTRKT